MSIDAVSGGSNPSQALSPTDASQPDAAEIQQFEQAMNSPAATDEATARAAIEDTMRYNIMRKMITDSFSRSRKMLGHDD